MTIIKQCTCKDEEQDRMYGKQMRVWNYHSIDRASTIKCKCTVCGAKKEFKK